jgi:hypothetical protein
LECHKKSYKRDKETQTGMSHGFSIFLICLIFAEKYSESLETIFTNSLVSKVFFNVSVSYCNLLW